MDDWIMYQFFPAAQELDHTDFLESDRLVHLLRDAGFENIHVKREDRSKHERLGDFSDYASERHRSSQFIAMTDADYEQGLETIKTTIGDHGRDHRMESALCLMTVTANREQA